jgi:hypothetical protein
MTRIHLYSAAAAIAVASAALAASPLANVVIAVHKATQKTLNGYSFSVPAGELSAVPTVLVMGPDKVRYSQLALSKFPLRFNMRATQQCPGIEWAQSRVPYIYIGDKRWPQDAGVKPLVQPEGHEYQASLSVLRNTIEFKPELDAVGRCNQVIDSHSVQGRPPADLLKEGFWIRVEGMVRARITPGCEYVPPKEVGFHEYPTSPQYERWLPVWINCMPTGYKETHRLPPEPHRVKPEGHRLAGLIRLVDLAAVNSPLKHVCPATVVFRGKVQSNRAIKGSYRLVGSDGYASPAYPFSLPDNGERSVSWQRRVDVPAASGGMAAPGAGSWPRKVSGWLQLEVSVAEPEAETRRSERADYKVECQAPANPQRTIGSPGGGA